MGNREFRGAYCGGFEDFLEGKAKCIASLKFWSAARTLSRLRKQALKPECATVRSPEKVGRYSFRATKLSFFVDVRIGP